MATLRPFRALRPNRSDAPRIASVPYDVVTTDDARKLAAGNPLSFLRVSRAELELPPGTDPYDDAVYDRAVATFEKLKPSFVVEPEPSVYCYRLRMGAHEQTGIAACYSIDEYDRGVIKKHERTRRDKEDDRTRHMIALGAQTGPVFLTYRTDDTVARLTATVTTSEPLFDFDADDGVRHTVWQVDGIIRDRLVAAFASIPALYIADGHHRAASAARARADIIKAGITRTSLGDEADYTTFLAVAFPNSQVQILPYNRVVQDLGDNTPEQFRNAVAERFHVAPGSPRPAKRGDISMYTDGKWSTLRFRASLDPSDIIKSLDVSILQDHLLAPLLGIVDVTTDKRIDFIGGARGTEALEELVNSGKAAAAFSLYPVSVSDLMSVADAGGIMPPKSTWFEPKLRDGLLIHLI